MSTPFARHRIPDAYDRRTEAKLSTGAVYAALDTAHAQLTCTTLKLPDSPQGPSPNWPHPDRDFVELFLDSVEARHQQYLEAGNQKESAERSKETLGEQASLDDLGGEGQ